MRFIYKDRVSKSARGNRIFNVPLPTLYIVCLLVALAGNKSVYAQSSPSVGSGVNGLIVGAVQGVPKVFLPNLGFAGDAVYERTSIPPTDPRYSTTSQQPQLRDGQVIANSRIDPFTDAQLSVDLPENGVANVEEAWLLFNKLPGGVAIRAGRFKPKFGLLDETDTFQLPMLDRPQALSDYLGDGLSDDGMQLDYVIPMPWDINLKAYLSIGQGDMLGANQSSTASALSYLATLEVAQDVFETGSLVMGASFAQGPSPYGDSETLIDPYFQLQVAPTQRQIFTWSAEGMFAQRHGTTYASSRTGFYTFLDYNFALFYHVGFLADWVQAPGPLSQSGTFPDAYPGAPTNGSCVSLSPNFTWFVSDNTRLRIQYTHTSAMGVQRATDAVALQATFSMGNLKQLE